MRDLKIYTLFLIFFISLFVSEIYAAKTDGDKKFTVVIDAGHGGKDFGATDNGVMEKNINLKVAKQLEALIKKKMKNADVVMTREGDTYLTLQQRADKANKAQGDIFISIHTNSVDKKNRNRKSIEGSSVYTLGLHKDENNLEVAMRENSVIELEKDYEQKYSGFDPQRDESYIIFEMAQKKNLSQSIMLAENIEKELVKAGRKDRGVHQAGFWVLWATSMPSVLVELDFICNPQSAKYISSDKGAKELAEAIFKALQKYEESWNKNFKNPSSQTYILGSPTELEETYTVTEQTVATAKKRTRVSQPAQSNSQKINSSVERRRRSNRSKELSLANSYEFECLYFPEAKSYATASVDMTEDLVQVNDSRTVTSKTSKNQLKAEKKRREKEEKEAKKREKEREKILAQEKKKKRREDAHNAKLNKLVTVYKIQILASSDLLNQNSSRFCGLTPITTFKENNLYKYYYGESTNKEELEAVLADVRKKIPDAFIVESKKTMIKD
ncbi:MAG: N-acetylmuramoyl-L-alanine amidase [Muribaculaceae bacterium]|nr:N-acetylmuramoyl-L-alanine amidase [Muribaculaceae bacterium]